MSNPPEYPDYRGWAASGGGQDSWGAYAGYGGYPASNGASSRPAGPARPLWIAVAVLGAAIFGVSFAAPVALDWAVRAAAVAAVVAALGLLPRQGSHGWVAVTAATVGLVDAVGTWSGGVVGGWALIVVVVLDGLQMIAAVGALLAESGVLGAGERDDESDYHAYQQYAQAYQAYATQYQQPAPHQEVQAHGQGQALGHAEGSGRARGVERAGSRADAAQESYAAMQQGHAPYGGAPASGAAAAASAPTGQRRDPGLPGVARGGPPQPPAHPPGAQPPRQTGSG